MSKQTIIDAQKKEIAELRAKVEDIETAFRQTHHSVDAVLYEVIKKYGDEELKITIAVPDTDSVPKITASKEDETYVIRVES